MDPGSIICPPGVSKLLFEGAVQDADWRTAVGSDIVIHRADIESDLVGRLDFRSGGALRLGGDVTMNAYQGNIDRDASFVAEDDVLVEGSIHNDRRRNIFNNQTTYGHIDIEIESKAASVTVGRSVRRSTGT